MTFIGNKIASVPKDDDHNFGHGKAEYMFSLFISISMIAVSIKTIIDSAKTLFTGSEISFSCSMYYYYNYKVVIIYLYKINV